MSTLGWIILMLVVVSAIYLLFKTLAPVQPQRKPLDSQSPEVSPAKAGDEFEIAHDLTTTTREIPNLPPVYGDNKLVVLIQDPRRLYVYWDLDSQKSSWLHQVDKRHLVLRVHNVTDTENAWDAYSFWDIILDQSANNWYVDVPQSNGRFFVTLGVILADGSFVELIRSNMVKMPRDQQSDQIDPDWPPIAGIQYLFESGYHMQQTSSPELLRKKEDQH